MIQFADFLQTSIENNSSRIVAGFDPSIDKFPLFLLKQAQAACNNSEESIERALIEFYSAALDAIGTKIAAIKPNTAFFEQYGIGGLKALQAICSQINQRKLPLIADAKRGDIGSTAQAYSNAFLSHASAFSADCNLIQADALTVNPFLGFDTVEVFLKDCVNNGKGLFVLVKTSNPGSSALQGIKDRDGLSVSDHVANWVAANAQQLKGACGLSGLGAVVGATYPEEAKALRARMPESFFLIPGMGAQGGSATDALAGFAKDLKIGSFSAGVINISRGLFSDLPDNISNLNELKIVFQARVEHFNKQVAEAIKAG